MRVPEIQPQVGTVVPNVPQLNIPNALSGASGENVWKANERLGDAGSKLSEVVNAHLQEKQKQKNDAYTATLNTNFRLNLQDKLLNENTEKVKIDGKDVERPIGLLNRGLHQAEGATQEFDQYYKQLKDGYVSSAPTPELGLKLGQEMDNQYLQSRETIIKHEAKQGKQVLINSHTSNLAQQVHDAAAINNPVQLLNAVNKAKETQGQLNQVTGADEDTAEKNLKDRAGDIVASSVKSTLMATGDLDKAQQMLDVAEGDIQPDRYEKINEMLSTGMDRIEKQQERVQTQKYISNEANYLTKFAAGEANWDNLDDISQQVRDGNLPEKFGAALSDVIASKGDYEPNSIQNENYPKFIEGVYNARSQEEIHSTLLNVLKDHKDISQEKMAVLINEAVKRGKNVPLKTDDELKNASPEQNGVDLAVKAGLKFGQQNRLSGQDQADIYQDFVKEVGNGKAPEEAHQTALKNYAIRKNPALQNIPQEGQIMIDAQGNKATVFPDGSWKEITGGGSAGKSSGSDKKPEKKEAKKPNAVQSK